MAGGGDTMTTPHTGGKALGYCTAIWTYAPSHFCALQGGQSSAGSHYSEALFDLYSSGMMMISLKWALAVR